MKSDQPTSFAPTLTMTADADVIDCSSPICGDSVSPPAVCGPSSPAAIVAELQARLTTFDPDSEPKTSAYASAERRQAVSCFVGLDSLLFPMPAAVESPMT